jgi:hypothetical protein
VARQRRSPRLLARHPPLDVLRERLDAARDLAPQARLRARRLGARALGRRSGRVAATRRLALGAPRRLLRLGDARCLDARRLGVAGRALDPRLGRLQLAAALAREAGAARLPRRALGVQLRRGGGGGARRRRLGRCRDLAPRRLELAGPGGVGVGKPLRPPALLLVQPLARARGGRVAAAPAAVLLRREPRLQVLQRRRERGALLARRRLALRRRRQRGGALGGAPLQRGQLRLAAGGLGAERAQRAVLLREAAVDGGEARLLLLQLARELAQVLRLALARAPEALVLVLGGGQLLLQPGDRGLERRGAAGRAAGGPRAGEGGVAGCGGARGRTCVLESIPECAWGDAWGELANRVPRWPAASSSAAASAGLGTVISRGCGADSRLKRSLQGAIRGPIESASRDTVCSPSWSNVDRPKIRSN